MKTAACVNDCRTCPRYVATTLGGKQELNQVAILWYRCGWNDQVVADDEIMCGGCASAAWCGYGIRECCKEREIDTCAKCSEYPCSKIRQAFAKSEQYRQTTYYVCDYRQYALLETAFFRKQSRLNKLRG